MPATSLRRQRVRGLGDIAEGTPPAPAPRRGEADVWNVITGYSLLLLPPAALLALGVYVWKSRKPRRR